jgi:porphobilinogen synthase
VSFPQEGRGGCGARNGCALSCARRASRPSSSSTPLRRAGEGRRQEIATLPGCFHLAPDQAAREAREVEALGIAASSSRSARAKDPAGSEASDDEGVVQQAIRAIRAECRELLVLTDVCLCEYTSHGHCGVVEGEEVQNDPSWRASRAWRCPMPGRARTWWPLGHDGRSRRRHPTRLDAAGFAETAILSYAVKYASALLRPVPRGGGLAPQFGDRRGYQMDPPNVREALREVRLDVAEGADMVMVKPALAYLDVIRAVREAVDVPVAAYNVSGEYAMVKAAAQRGWIDERRVVLETLGSIARAGADVILTYHALDFARWTS